ncbi:hypothetical protein LJC63_11245, partial [Ruminococcaceae bacterium OttesenSCG-928-L11]|nr:hypothetical protein [Ruminococcaceae bacterium OttesenSCG-928-L11]
TLIFEKEGGADTSGGGASDVDYFVISSFDDGTKTYGGDELATLGMDTFYILLYKDGKAEMFMGQLSSGTWKDGTLDIEGIGALEYTIKGDELTLDMAGTKAIFTRSKDKPPASPAGASDSTAAGTSGAGDSDADYFVISSMSDGTTTYSGEILATLGMDTLYILLHKDGTAEMFMGQLVSGTWTEETLEIEGMGTLEYTISGDEMTVDMAGSELVLIRSSDTPPGSPAATAVFSGGATTSARQFNTPAQWWIGDWYGYWEAYAASGDWGHLESEKWDCYAKIIMDDNGIGQIYAWDDDIDVLLADIELSHESGAGEMGIALPTGGWFWDDELEYSEWAIDPSIFDYGDYMVISGLYEATENAGGFYYTFYLRPWGMLWDEFPDDLRPPNYDWYLENYELDMPPSATMLNQ